MSWGEELRKPANVIAIIIGALGVIVGLLGGLYFYYKGQRAGQLTMRVDQVQVFDKNRIGQLPLRVLDAAGNVITDNVFAANVAIWNSGNAEITKEAVREPFRILLGGNVVPLDLTLIYISSPYQKFVLTRDGQISWDHFDAGEGFRLRIIYTNAAMLNVILKGSAPDSKELNDLQELQKWGTVRNFGVLFTLMIQCLLIVVYLYFWLRQGFYSRLIAGMAALTAFASIIYVGFELRNYSVGAVPVPAPPFGVETTGVTRP